jgi:hypothetical protein
MDAVQAERIERAALPEISPWMPHDVGRVPNSYKAPFDPDRQYGARFHHPVRHHDRKPFRGSQLASSASPGTGVGMSTFSDLTGSSETGCWFTVVRDVSVVFHSDNAMFRTPPPTAVLHEAICVLRMDAAPSLAMGR